MNKAYIEVVELNVHDVVTASTVCDPNCDVEGEGF